MYDVDMLGRRGWPTWPISLPVVVDATLLAALRERQPQPRVVFPDLAARPRTTPPVGADPQRRRQRLHARPQPERR